MSQGCGDCSSGKQAAGLWRQRPRQEARGTAEEGSGRAGWLGSVPKLLTAEGTRVQSWGLSEGSGWKWGFLNKRGYKRKGFRICTGEIRDQPIKGKRLGGLGGSRVGCHCLSLALSALELVMHRATNCYLLQLQPQMLYAFGIHVTALLQDAWCLVCKNQVSQQVRKLVI